MVVLVLTKGIPHRIQDLNSGNVGDNPGASYTSWQQGTASFASVDSELTLLWHDLDAGENGAAMDSAADNRVINPYYNVSSPIAGFGRERVADSKHFESLSNRWRMRWSRNGSVSDAGEMYLTARLDGNSVAAVREMIYRCQLAHYDPQKDFLIQDKHQNGTYDNSGYQAAENLMSPHWPSTLYEDTNLFVIGQSGAPASGTTSTTRFSGQVAAWAGYGGNHAGGPWTGFISTFEGQLCLGAIYNGFESYNARKFGGVGGFSDHGQLSDWIDAGGTLGVGNVWEPLSDAAPRNEVLWEHYFLAGRSWVEAAWSSVRYLSWQTLVLGDPLTRYTEDEPLQVSLSSTGSLSETGGELAWVEVAVSQPPAEDLAVPLEWSGADLEQDFTVLGATSSEVLIPAGEMSASIQLVALADEAIEGEEILAVSVPSSARYVAPENPAEIGIEDRPFAQWLLSQSLTSADGDPDGDGLTNLVEYALGDDPHAPNAGPEVRDEGGPAFFFTKNPMATDLSVRAEFSSDLQNWQTMEPEGVGGEFRLRGEGPQGYFRLRVELD